MESDDADEGDVREEPKDSPAVVDIEPDQRGRPTKFSDKLVAKILAMAAAGHTDAKIAKTIGISRSTLGLWKAQHGDFSVALKEAKDVADELVEASLFRLAVGYHEPAVKFFCHEGVVISQKYIEHHAPDKTAAIFWLKNRRPDRWRDVQKLEHSGRIEGAATAIQVVIALPPNGTESE